MMDSQLREKPHYIGHRKRLTKKFIAHGASLHDYELVELLLFYALKRKDTKNLAKALLEKFQTLQKLILANANELEQIPGIKKSSSLLFTLLHEIFSRMQLEPLEKITIIASSEQVLNYYKTVMGHLKKEQFRVMFLNNKNHLLADEILQLGTINRTAIYPREILHKAFELGASAFIMVHNHPSGDPQPSRQDVIITRQMKDIAEKVDLILLDHLIIGKTTYKSLKEMCLI